MNFSLNYLSLAGLLLFISGLIANIFIFFNKRNNIVSITLSFFTFLGSMWGLGEYFLFNAIDERTALFWGRFINFSPVLIVATTYHFICAFKNKIQDKKKKIYIYYFISIMLSVLALIFPNYNIPKVEKMFGFYYPQAGIIFYFITFFFFYIILD